jgi:hypothetical protein
MPKFIELHDNETKSPILVNVNTIYSIYFDKKKNATLVVGLCFTFHVYETVEAVKRLLYTFACKR